MAFRWMSGLINHLYLHCCFQSFRFYTVAAIWEFLRRYFKHGPLGILFGYGEGLSQEPYLNPWNLHFFWNGATPNSQKLFLFLLRLSASLHVANEAPCSWLGYGVWSTPRTCFISSLWGVANPRTTMPFPNNFFLNLVLHVTSLIACLQDSVPDGSFHRSILA